MRPEFERVADGFAERRLSLMPDVRIERAGAAFAALCPARPELDFVNRIHGPASAERLAALEALYAADGLRPWVELPEGWEPPGYARVGTLDILAGEPAALPSEGVREIGPDEADVFAATLSDGHGAPPFARPPVARWAGQPGWRLYLAELDGVPAAAAALVVDGEIGYLAAASTLPAFRRRGCQTALIRRRISDVAEAGCREVFSLTAKPESRRNLERAGLELAYTKTTWRKR